VGGFSAPTLLVSQLKSNKNRFGQKILRVEEERVRRADRTPHQLTAQWVNNEAFDINPEKDGCQSTGVPLRESNPEQKEFRRRPEERPVCHSPPFFTRVVVLNSQFDNAATGFDDSS